MMYQFAKTLEVYLQAKNQFHPSHFLRNCKDVVLGTLDMPGYSHPKRYYQLGKDVRV